MSEWQPIETAPKDDRILAWSPGMEEVFLMEWNEFNEPPGWRPENWEMNFDEESQPTHWMPLPTPPK